MTLPSRESCGDLNAQTCADRFTLRGWAPAIGPGYDATHLCFHPSMGGRRKNFCNSQIVCVFSVHRHIIYNPNHKSGLSSNVVLSLRLPDHTNQTRSLQALYTWVLIHFSLRALSTGKLHNVDLSPINVS